MKKSDFKHMKAAILVTHEFDEVEFITIKHMLEQNGMEVHVVSPDKEMDRPLSIIRSEKLPKEYDGYMIKVKHDIKEININDYQLLIIIGGKENAEKLAKNEDVLDVINLFLESKHLIACISHGMQLLAKTFAIQGRFLTSMQDYKLPLINKGALWIDDHVVNDKGLITAKTTFDLQEFTLKIMESLGTCKVLREFAERKGMTDQEVSMPY